MKGIVLGIVEDDDGLPHIALGIPNNGMVVMTPTHAAMIFDQLGVILESIGYFAAEEAEQPVEQMVMSGKKGELH